MANPTPDSTTATTAAIDLDAYFARIGYRGSRAPTLATLQAIHALHPRAIAFENLDPLAGREVALDVHSLQRKLVAGARGGWCFEHNLLLWQVLVALGFDASGLAARVVWNAPSGTASPRSHMLLRVKIDGDTYVADVGFGGLTLTAPLRLEADVEQKTPHEPARLLARDAGWELQCRVGDRVDDRGDDRGDDNWQPLYRFDLQPQLLPDYEVTNWYLAHHPRSRFVNGLICARPDEGLRYALLDNRYSVYHADGRIDRARLASGAEIRAVLVRDFRIDVPQDPRLDAALQRIAERAATA